MLEAMRRGAKSWVAKGLMLLLIASFAVWGIGDVFSTRGDSTVARVGDQTVTVDEFAAALQRQRNALSQQAGRGISYSDMVSLGFDRRVLDGLIRDAAFAHELDRLGLAAPDRAVAEAIRSNPAFQSGDGFSSSRYQLTLNQLGFAPAEFEALTREVLGQQILVDAFNLAPDALPGAAQRIAAFRAERRGAVSLTLPLASAPEAGDPGQDALRSYFQENRERYRRPERRSGTLLHVSIPALAAEAAPTEAEIAAAYEARRERYETPATRTLDQLPLGNASEADVARVVAGEMAFEALARELGEDPADLSLGEVTRADLPPAVAEAVFAATEPGIVGPVEAPAGPVLIRIRAVEAGGTVPLEAVRAEIRGALAREAELARAPEIARRIEDLRAEGLSLPEIAEATEARRVSFEGLARDGTLAGGGRAEGVLAETAVREEIFAALDYEEREIIETEAGGYAVVMVERIAEASVPSLAEIRDEVAADWRRDARRDALLEEARDLAGAVGRGETTLAEIAATHGVETVEHAPFLRDSPPPGLPAGVVEALFAAGEGEAAAAASGEGVVLARLARVVPAGPERLAGLSAEIDGRFSEMLDEDRLALFAAALRDRLGVSIDEDAIDATLARLGAARGDG